jgi:signal transduction histidine kinase
VVAFSALLAAVVSALAVQIVALRRMEVTFAAMKDHEEQMRLALELEDAVRDQYGHQARFVLGESLDLIDYERARSRAHELSRSLSVRLDEPDAMAWMIEIREASAELDRLFRENVAPAVESRDPTAKVAHERTYPLVSRIERNVDDIFERLQQAISVFRRDLVAIQGDVLRWTAGLLVIMPVFVAAAVLYLSRSVARPLAQLSEGSAALARGDLDTRIDIDTPDEFGALATEFNAMTVALKQHHEKLVESEKLAGIGRVAAGIAHELNNPLQVMLGYLSLNRDLTDRRLAGQLAVVEEEALRCKDIVAGLFELSRPTFMPAPVDLRELCDDVAVGLRATAQPGATRLSVDGAAEALGDRHKLRQVLFNLMKNAVEAAGPTGEVDVAVGSAGELVEVAVSDSGAGIPPDARARVFEPFFTTKPSGTGLGLAVSRAIARAHRGDIAFEQRERGGAVFILRLPRAPEARS